MSREAVEALCTSASTPAEVARLGFIVRATPNGYLVQDAAGGVLRDTITANLAREVGQSSAGTYLQAGIVWLRDQKDPIPATALNDIQCKILADFADAQIADDLKYGKQG